MSNGLTLPFQATLNTEAEAFRIVVTGGGTAIYGMGLGTDRFGDTGQGVVGEADVGQGVFGHASGSGGIGVQGQSDSGDGIHGVGSTAGVRGESQQGEGVHGVTHATSAGVAGFNYNTQGGPGVWGQSQNGEGVHGLSHSQNAGVAGFNDNATGGTGVGGVSQNGDGVHGLSHSAQHAGVSGNNDQGGTGVHAETSSHSGNALDIHGPIRVASSGDGTTPAAFTFTVSLDNIYPPIPATSSNIYGAAARIDHPLIDGDPSVLLFVTAVARQQPESTTLPPHTAVTYGLFGVPLGQPTVKGKWVLVTQGIESFPFTNQLSVGDKFNILVIRTM